MEEPVPPGKQGGSCIRRWHATRDTRCGCSPECRDLALAGKRRARVYRELGRTPPDRSEAAFAALDRMLAAGRQPLEISITAGIDHESLNNALRDRRRGGWKRMSAPWAAGIISAEHSAPAGGRIPATGTRRRLQALAWSGHSAAVLAPVLGVSARTLEKLRSDTGPSTVPVETADAVRHHYEPLLKTAGDPAVAGKAKAKGWPPAAAWDDIDDPHERPKGVGRVPKQTRHPTASHP